MLLRELALCRPRADSSRLFFFNCSDQLVAAAEQLPRLFAETPLLSDGGLGAKCSENLARSTTSSWLSVSERSSDGGLLGVVMSSKSMLKPGTPAYCLAGEVFSSGLVGLGGGSSSTTKPGIYLPGFAMVVIILRPSALSEPLES